MIENDVQKLLSDFGDGIIQSNYELCHQLLTPSRREQTTVEQLATEISPDGRHNFLCEIMQADPADVDRLPDPVLYQIDGFPHRDPPEGVDLATSRGWYSLQLQPDDASGYDACGEMAIFVQTTPNGPLIERFELVWPD